jgi:hypothetical protein
MDFSEKMLKYETKIIKGVLGNFALRGDMSLGEEGNN